MSDSPWPRTSPPQFCLHGAQDKGLSGRVAIAPTRMTTYIRFTVYYGRPSHSKFVEPSKVAWGKPTERGRLRMLADAHDEARAATDP